MLGDRLRSVTARVKDGVERLRRDDDGPDQAPVVFRVNDDPAAEPLPPPIMTSDPVDEELERLDETEAPPVEVDESIGLVELFGDIDPMPPVPLTEPHVMGVTQVVERMVGLSGVGLFEDRRVRRVTGRLGDRLTVAAGPDGITVRGLLRTRHTPWKQVQELTFTSRYDQIRGGLVSQLADDVAGRMLPIPIPGLKWLLGRIVGGISNLYERRAFTPEEQQELRTGLGHTLTDIKRRGLDIELAGPLRAVMFLSYGLSAAIEAEATARGIKVVGVSRTA